MAVAGSARLERGEPLLHFAHRRAQRRRLLQFCLGLLQRTLKLRQCRRQSAGLHHDLSRGEPLRIDLGQNRIVDWHRTERRVVR